MEEMTVFDVRSFEPRFRHALIFSMFEGLTPGSGFVLVNDHDPVPLKRQFMALALPGFEWSYLQEGPHLWRIRILKTRVREDVAKGRCGGDRQD